MKQTPTNKHPEISGLSALALVGQLGLIVALCIVGGLFAGLFVDRLLGGTGIVLVLGIFLGIGAGAVSAYKLLMKEAERGR